MIDDLLKSHIEWLRGDHERCNPFLADRIEALEARGKKAEAERADLLEALQAMRDRREEMTHSPKDGGPAFPNSVQPNFQCAEVGMSLRDWFAGQVIASVKGWHPADKGGKSAATVAYEIADAMIEQRKGKNDE